MFHEIIGGANACEWIMRAPFCTVVSGHYMAWWNSIISATFLGFNIWFTLLVKTSHSYDKM